MHSSSFATLVVFVACAQSALSVKTGCEDVGPPAACQKGLQFLKMSGFTCGSSVYEAAKSLDLDADMMKKLKDNVKKTDLISDFCMKTCDADTNVCSKSASAFMQLKFDAVDTKIAEKFMEKFAAELKLNLKMKKDAPLTVVIATASERTASGSDRRRLALEKHVVKVTIGAASGQKPPLLMMKDLEEKVKKGTLEGTVSKSAIVQGSMKTIPRKPVEPTMSLKTLIALVLLGFILFIVLCCCCCCKLCGCCCFKKSKEAKGNGTNYGAMDD